jgi:hypothetical protein
MKAEKFQKYFNGAVNVLVPVSFLFLAVFYFGKCDGAAAIGGVMIVLLVAKAALNKFLQ